jgi:GR25 family glycosyltransferase involved in LPS biosynthesis
MKIIYINRSARADRRANLEQRLARFGLKADRFNAIERNFFLQNNSNLNNAALGCYHSHFCIYRLIKANGWEETLILEDDCDFISNPEISDKPKEWDIIHFGLSDQGQGYYKNQTEWLGHAYLVNLKCIDKLIERTKIIERAIDHQLFMLQDDLSIYDIRPRIAIQDGTRSDLR